MAKRLQYRRLLVLVLLLGAAFAGLGYRLVDLQVLRHAELAGKAQQNTQREFFIEPRRGDILDARGNPLATSVFVKTVCADPTIMSNYQAVVARAIAPLLEMPEGELYLRLQPRYRTNVQGKVSPYLSNVLKRKVPVETWEKVQLAMQQLEFGVDEKSLPPSRQKFFRDLRRVGIFTERVDDQQRVYPNEHLAAHVLGYVGMDGNTNSPTFGQTIGVDGIERTLNSKLSGVRGWRVTETDSRRREVVTFREQDIEPRDGLNVVLTIDSVIQHLTETALAEAMERHAPISISGIVTRPRTGEILALATLPNFNPNAPGSDPHARRNRAITDIIEPGSTFKIVVVSGALNDRTVTLRDTFDCEQGRFVYGGRVLHDHDPYGVLSVETIITKSSNIGAAKIGIKMGERRLHEYIHEFGFSQRTLIPLPGEVGGIVHPVKNWSKVSIAQIPMGHGVAVTRLQMAMAMSAIANQGVLMRPMLVSRLQDRAGNVVAQYAPQPVRQVISPAAARDMTAALQTVVAVGGTAPRAVLEHYTVAGKTGTAQKVEDGRYVRGKYISSFIGFFPANQPELCISVVMDEPKNGYYGGQTAAPVFKAIAEAAANYLNIRPDKGDLVSDGSPTITLPADAGPIRTVSARSIKQP